MGAAHEIRLARMTDAGEALERAGIARARDEAAAAREARADELERLLLGGAPTGRRSDVPHGCADERDALADARDLAADRREVELRWLAFELGFEGEARALLETPEARVRRSSSAYWRAVAARARSARAPR